MIKKYFKNKKGSVEAINTVVVMLMVISLFIFFLDLIFFTRTYIGMSNFVDGIARTISIQGGISNTMPTNFPGGTDLYFSRSEIKSNAKSMADRHSLNNSKLTMYLHHKTYSPSINRYTYIISNDNNFKPKNTTTVISDKVDIDYGQPFTVGFQYEYEFILTGAKIKVKIKRSALSEYKHPDSKNRWDKF